MNWKDNFPKENRYYETENGILYNGDNREILDNIPKNSIDLIYIDPPYGINKDKVFGLPKWKSTEEHYKFLDSLGLSIIRKTDIKGKKSNYGIAHYLYWIYKKLILMKELLSEQGSIYVHIDWHVGHYVRVLMDEIFGNENFVNEIIWAYKSGGVSVNYFARKHDILFLYSKSKNYIFNMMKEKSYNRGLKPYRFKNIEEYKDDLGWYTLVNMRDIWEIDMVGRTSSERVNYPTQKPEKLLERIIKASSNENSIVADFFAGSGTTGIVAEKLSRRWIMCDNNENSLKVIKQRLKGDL